MTRFENGPAHGVPLMIRRAPRFLRLVVTPAGAVDALDQLDDTPAADETIHVYEVTTQDGFAFVDFRGGKGSGCYPIVTYRYLTPQPADAQLRTTAAWQHWCHARAAQFPLT